MKTNKVLIKALRVTADSLDNPNKFYDWYAPNHCNCGLLIKNIIKIGKGIEESKAIEEIVEYTYNKGDGMGLWSLDSLKNYCPVTGLPINDLYLFLTLMGLEEEDFAEIENLKSINQGKNKVDYKDRLIVARYMRNKANELETQFHQELE